MSSDIALWTSGMLAMSVRFSRSSRSYMYMTRSSSSAWMARMPPCLAADSMMAQRWPRRIIRPLPMGRTSVVKILRLAKPAWMVSGIWSITSGGTAPCSITCKP
jgi:hypothetical protein